MTEHVNSVSGEGRPALPASAPRNSAAMPDDDSAATPASDAIAATPSDTATAGSQPVAVFVREVAPAAIRPVAATPGNAQAPVGSRPVAVLASDTATGPRCWFCRWVVRADANYCANCGRWLTPEERASGGTSADRRGLGRSPRPSASQDVGVVLKVLALMALIALLYMTLFAY